MAPRAGVATLKVVGSSCSEVHSREGKWAEKGRGGRREGHPGSPGGRCGHQGNVFFQLTMHYINLLLITVEKDTSEK